MSFIKRVYVDEQTLITAQNLNDIQDSALQSETQIAQLNSALNTKADLPNEAGEAGQCLATDGAGSTYWKTVSGGGGGGGTSDYRELSNKPQIAGVTLSGNKQLSDLGIASVASLDGKISNPGGGTTGQVLTKTDGGESWETPSAGVTDFNQLNNRPQYNGSAMTNATNIPEVKTSAWDGKITNPSGGTTGQILTKTASGEVWQDPPSGSFNNLTGKPSYNGSAMSNTTNIPLVKTSVWDGKQNKITCTSVSLDTTWQHTYSGAYMHTASVSGISSTSKVIVSPHPNTYNEYMTNSVYCSSVTSGEVVFYAATAPTTTIRANIMFWDED